MQTFLPYSDFKESARVLDRQRLGKQRVETLQIMSSLLKGTGWGNHPATRMWRGYEFALFRYQQAVCFEWVDRGYVDTCFVKTAQLLFDSNNDSYSRTPPWLGDLEFHTSHQSNLVRKDEGHYGPIFPCVPMDLEYVWPVD